MVGDGMMWMRVVIDSDVDGGGDKIMMWVRVVIL